MPKHHITIVIGDGQLDVKSSLPNDVMILGFMDMAKHVKLMSMINNPEEKQQRIVQPKGPMPPNLHVKD